MDGEFNGHFLGVLGGMGPMAGAAFMMRLTALTVVQKEQQHVPTILWSDPRVPGRPEAYLNGGADPLPWMKNGIANLQRAGAKAIVIPCNTAHLWYEQLTACTVLPILHVVQAVIDQLRHQGVDRGLIGLLGTEVTLRLGLYQHMLEAQGYECITLRQDEIKRHCTQPILLVKTNCMGQAFEPAMQGVRLLQQRGADAVVLGCTELPLAIPHLQRSALGIPIADSLDALALASLDWYRSERACD
jgi:aspartate racemase